MKKNNKITFIVTFSTLILFVALTFFTVSSVVDDSRDFAPEDSEALYGGQIETGYPFAGYLLAYEDTNRVNVCGATFIKSNAIVTSAHCINQSASVYVGENEFVYRTSENFQTDYSTVLPSWDNVDNGSDIAISLLSEGDTPDISTFANITSPRESCNYEVVAYGRTENEDNNPSRVRLRKSAEVCISGISSDRFYIKSDDGGICFGDSGSPVFEKDTNKLVGVVSAIRIEGEEDRREPCKINNTAVVTRVDVRGEFISSAVDVPIVDPSIAICDESCDIKSCATGLVCNSNNRCELPTGGCLADRADYCSAAENVLCQSGNSCVINSCVETIEFDDSFNFGSVFSDLEIDLDFRQISNGERVLVVFMVFGIVLGISYLAKNREYKQ